MFIKIKSSNRNRAACFHHLSERSKLFYVKMVYKRECALSSHNTLWERNHLKIPLVSERFCRGCCCVLLLFCRCYQVIQDSIVLFSCPSPNVWLPYLLADQPKNRVLVCTRSQFKYPFKYQIFPSKMKHKNSIDSLFLAMPQWNIPAFWMIPVTFTLPLIRFCYKRFGQLEYWSIQLHFIIGALWKSLSPFIFGSFVSHFWAHPYAAIEYQILTGQSLPNGRPRIPLSSDFIAVELFNLQRTNKP